MVLCLLFSLQGWLKEGIKLQIDTDNESVPTADSAKRFLTQRGTGKVKPEVITVTIDRGQCFKYLGVRAARSQLQRLLP